MFEVWDGGIESEKEKRGDATFLGLGIVSINELHIASDSRHVIPLQGRPNYGARNDDESYINGLLTVEFILVEKSYSRMVKQAPPYTKMTESPHSPGTRRQGKITYSKTCVLII